MEMGWCRQENKLVAAITFLLRNLVPGGRAWLLTLTYLPFPMNTVFFFFFPFYVTGSLIILPPNEFQMRDPRYQGCEPVPDAPWACWAHMICALTFLQAEQEVKTQVLTIKKNP